MAEFVALPIFDEEGRETGRLMKVDTRHFLGEAGSEVAHRHIKVVNKNSVYELEMLDRILSGLPIPPRLVGAALVTADKARRHIELMDVSNAHPKHDWWRTIPGYSNYDMSSYKAVATNVDGKSVSIVKGGSLDSVLLSDDDGVTRRMSIEHLFRQTFPELA